MQFDKIPESLLKNIIDTHPDKGQEWVERLSELLNKYQELWQINLISFMPDLSYNLVIRARHFATQKNFIFKAGVPSNNLDAEIAALKLYAGNGCIRLVNSSSIDGVMLLEEASPGMTLAPLTRNGKDELAVKICAAIIDKLHSQEMPRNIEAFKFPTLDQRISDFDNIRSLILEKKIDFDLGILELAAQEYAYLLSSTKRRVILHGDLHHFNILSAKRDDWLAIDPHGVIGDPAFEISAFMRNPYPEFLTLTDFKDLLQQRLDTFANLLSYDKRRMWGWSFAQTILCAGWSLQDHGSGWEEWYITAKHILELEPS